MMEVKEYGWAFGQIADMEAWFNTLKTNKKMNPAKPISITGYSLGGHLATAFTLLHKDESIALDTALIKETYTFNGAGVGKVAESTSLPQILEKFNQHRIIGGNSDFFTDPVSLQYYNELKDVLTEGDDITSAQVSACISNVKDHAEESDMYEIDFLLKALERVKDVVKEAERVNSTIASGTSSDPAKKVNTINIAAAGLDYQLAVIRAGMETESF